MSKTPFHAAPPAEVTIVTTTRCNQQCSYCCLARRPAAAPPWPAVRGALDALLASPVDRVRVSFTGGEPLLALPLIRRAVRYIDASRRPSQSVTFKLLTNGLRLNSRTLSWLERRGVQLQISLDGARDAQEIRSAGSFDAVDGVFDLLRRRSPAYLHTSVTAAVTLVPEAVPLLADSVAHLIGTGVGTIRITPAMDAENGHGDLRPALGDQFATISRLALDHLRHTGKVPVSALRRGPPPELRRTVSPWFCGAVSGRSLAVDVDGEISTCLLAARTFAQSRPLGPLLRQAAGGLRVGPPDDGLTDRLAVITRNAAAARVFASSTPRHSAYGACRDCQCADQCRVCPLTTAGAYGRHRSLRVPPLVCAFNQAAARARSAFPLLPPRRRPH